MARPGVGAERVIEVIKGLEAEGREVTVTAVRERLGSGSFSTIGAVLADWRHKKATESRPAVPEPPEAVRHLFGQLWGETWNAATKSHEPERQAFARERQEFEKTKGEMLSEIARLEAGFEAEKERAALTEMSLTAERDSLREALNRLQTSLAAAEGALSEARSRAERAEERNRELSERMIAEAAKARALEARLSELEKRES